MKTQRAGSWTELRMLAEMFNDAQQFRMAESNKARSETVDHDPDSYLAGVVGLYKKAEEDLRKELVRCYRATVPEGILSWQVSTPGIGDSTLARLLGVIGHPVHATPKHWEGTGRERCQVDGEPFDRKVSELWAYCGYGDPARRGKIDENATNKAQILMSRGNPKAKMLTHLMAESVVKAGILHKEPITLHGKLYYEVKAEYDGRAHSGPCTGGYAGKPVRFVKCKTGPDGAYAVAGDPFQPSHVNAIAYRRLCKEILRDLWVAARDS